MEHIQYFNMLLFPVAIAFRALKALMRKDTPDDDMPGPLLNRLMFSVFRTERHLIGRVPMPFGLSVCAVLSKPDSE